MREVRRDALRVGVVGCGYWGSKHVRVLHGMPDVATLAVIDERVDRREAISHAFPQVTTHRRLEDALGDLDALVVATPPSTHADLAAAALENGTHVLVEKPLANSSVDAQRLIDLAEQRQLALMVGHTFEYNAAVWELRDLVQSQALGSVLYIDSARLNLGTYQPDCNVIWDLAPHDVSIINNVLDAQPSHVHAWGSRHMHAAYEDVAYVRLWYESLSVTAQIHVSWLDPCKVRRVTVVGSRKMAVYNDLADEHRVRIYDKGVGNPETDGPLHEQPMTYRYGGIYSPYISPDEPLHVEDRHFLDSILHNKTPSTDGYTGKAVVLVLEAAQRSLEEGRVVAVADVAYATPA